MKSIQIYSPLNGLEFLLIRKPNLWKEIQKIIALVNIVPPRRDTRDSKIKNGYINNEFCRVFSKYKWVNIVGALSLEVQERKKEVEGSGEIAIFNCNQTYLIKERVAIEVQFGKYSFVAYDLFVKHLAFYIGDKIDVGVEILPMKSLQTQMSSGVAYYEGELYNVIRQGRGVPAVPLVILGIAP